ncbi:MAG: chromosomal replication initiator protein DnaA [Roseovarius sp.]|nr:chromosomal replication initiator protein DnaA [Roseovarius sp.]MCY4290343.1 chromosomal replication initiator protein DnaA [Roseovarius sp.]
MTSDQWEKVKLEIMNDTSRANFKNWIEPLKFREVEEDVAIFNVSTSFLGEYVSNNFGDLILRKIKGFEPKLKRINFKVVSNVWEEHSEKTSKSDASAEAPSHKTQKARPVSNPLDESFTFDRFVVGKPNELAYAAARRVSEGGPAIFNPLFLYGGVGLGKTHLMHAIAWELISRKEDRNVVYLSAEQFMYRFVQALRGDSVMDFKETFRSVDVLMVDDVQFIAGKDSTQDEFFYTFNSLVANSKQIIISADRDPGEIENLEDRIKSRLQYGLVVDLHPTDFELRLGILQSKADQKAAEYPNVRIADGVFEFMAHRISTNVRVLEGALTRLYAFASLVGREVNLDLAKDCLADILRRSERKISIEEIQRLVVDYYNISISNLIGPSRERIYARPRQIAMYLCKQLTSRSMPEIGRRFGGRDHTTVLHGVRRIEALRINDAQVAEDLEILRRSLEG